MPVNEIAAGFPISRSAVSQHLKRAGLVVDRGEGTRRIYPVIPDALQVNRTYLDRFGKTPRRRSKRRPGALRGASRRW